jgi:hypothetical protein
MFDRIFSNVVTAVKYDEDEFKARRFARAFVRVTAGVALGAAVGAAAVTVTVDPVARVVAMLAAGTGSVSTGFPIQ